MSLFPQQDRDEFIEICNQRYGAMQTRLEKKGLPRLPFSRKQLREHILGLIWDRAPQDTPTNVVCYGPIRCQYCGGFFSLKECAIDHVVPLSKGGWVGLGNIALPCATCNAFKGEMSERAVTFLMTQFRADFPQDWEDLHHRLSTHGRLMSTVRRQQILARANGEMRPKIKKRGGPLPPIIQAIDDSF